MDSLFVKALSDEKDPFTFVASTDVVDRMGDIVEQSGWQLADFKKNPIALWMHRHDQPIGIWEKIAIEGGRLVAKLKLAARGTSPLIDSLHSLIEQRVLRAVSVGFRPLEYEEIKDKDGKWTGGYRFLKSILFEISVVTIPANPEALSLARAKGVSDDMLRTIFSPTGNEDPSKRRPAPGPTARSTSPPRSQKMSTLAERIAEREASIVTLKDQLTELSATEEQTEEVIAQIEELSGQIDGAVAGLDSLKRAQAALAKTAAPVERSQGGSPAAPAQIRARTKGRPSDLLFRSAIVLARSKVENRSVGDIIKVAYGGSQDLDVIIRAATAPAETSVAGWAAELVGETVGDFVDVLRPESIFFRLPMLTFTFGRGKIKLPGRGTKGLNGDFVGEGAPIPVKQALLTSVTLEPHKLGVITTLTRELAMLSDPAAEPLLRNMMIEDTRETIDTLLLDATAAAAGIRPGGLQTAATGANTRASAGTTLANIITDLRAATSAFTTANMGRRPVWIMHPQRVMSLNLVTNAAGAFMFRDELAGGTLLGIPVLHSTNVPPAVVFLVDAADLACAYDAVPQIDVSEQATLHMDGDIATVAPIVGGAGAGTPANPVRSLFQTASLGIRLLWDLTWNVRRPGSVQTITGVAW